MGRDGIYRIWEYTVSYHGAFWIFLPYGVQLHIMTHDTFIVWIYNKEEFQRQILIHPKQIGGNYMYSTSSSPWTLWDCYCTQLSWYWQFKFSTVVTLRMRNYQMSISCWTVLESSIIHRLSCFSYRYTPCLQKPRDTLLVLTMKATMTTKNSLILGMVILNVGRTHKVCKIGLHRQQNEYFVLPTIGYKY